MRVLVTGCSSPIGQEIIQNLNSLNFEVIGVRRGNCPIETQHKCVSQNILQDGLLDVIETYRPEIFIPLAWITTPGIFWNSTLNWQWYKSYVEALIKFKELGGDYVCGIGSCAEYSKQELPRILESFETNPETIYGKSKSKLHEQINLLGFRNSWLRVFNLVDLEFQTGSLNESILTALREKRELVLSNPNDLLDFVYYRDVANLISNVIQARVEGVYNIGNGSETSVEEYSQEILNRVPNNIRIVSPRNTESKIKRIVADNNKIKNLFPNFSFTSPSLIFDLVSNSIEGRLS